MERTHDGTHEDCFGCRIQTVQIDPRAMPSRRNNKPPSVSKTSNSWERGRVRDERGMPLLGPNGPVSVKEFASDRHGHEEKLRQIEHEKAAARDG